MPCPFFGVWNDMTTAAYETLKISVVPSWTQNITSQTWQKFKSREIFFFPFIRRRINLFVFSLSTFFRLLFLLYREPVFPSCLLLGVFASSSEILSLLLLPFFFHLLSVWFQKHPISWWKMVFGLCRCCIHKQMHEKLSQDFYFWIFFCVFLVFFYTMCTSRQKSAIIFSN